MMTHFIKKDKNKILKEFKKQKDMPILRDLYELLEKMKEQKI